MKQNEKADVALAQLGRYWPKVVKSGECWVWTGAKRNGRIRNGKTQFYSACFLRGKSMFLHRLFYTAYKGPVPPNMEIDHLCRNTLCVNPEHLEAVTHAENVRRGIAWHKIANLERSKTHCPQGHEYSAENTYVHRGQRHCKQCGRARSLAYQRKRRQASLAQAQKGA